MQKDLGKGIITDVIKRKKKLINSLRSHGSSPRFPEHIQVYQMTIVTGHESTAAAATRRRVPSAPSAHGG